MVKISHNYLQNLHKRRAKIKFVFETVYSENPCCNKTVNAAVVYSSNDHKTGETTLTLNQVSYAYAIEHPEREPDTGFTIAVEVTETNSIST